MHGKSKTKFYAIKSFGMDILGYFEDRSILYV